MPDETADSDESLDQSSDMMAEDGQVTDETADRDSDSEPISESAAFSATGSYDSIKNETTGYAFDVDHGYLPVVEEKQISVYTRKNGTTPYFYVMPGYVSEGSTPDEALTKEIETIKNNENLKLAMEPEKRPITVNGEEVPGIIYSVENSDGTSVLYVQHFITTFGNTYFSWTAYYPDGDGMTSMALQHAMETFSMLAG